MVRNRIPQDVVSDIKDFVENISECESCVMKTICTHDEVRRKGKSGKCPESIKNLPSIKKVRQSDNVGELDLEDFQAEQRTYVGVHSPSIKGKLNMTEAISEKKTIPVIKMVYWDGSKFIVRTDKAGCKRILCKLRVTMRSKFLALSIEDQTDIAQKGNMLKRTEETISEEDYLKIDKG